MRILLTGVSGFIGRRLSRHFFENGDAVTGLVRTPVSISDCETVVAPGLLPTNIRSAISGRSFDAVINLAASGVSPSDRDPSALARINSLLPCEFATIARDVEAKVFLQIGSSAEYAPTNSPEPLKEDSPQESGKLYGASKAAGSLLAQACGAQLRLPVVVLRLFNVFGPGEAPHRLLPSLVTQLERGGSVPLSPGTQVRDFIHVDDVCRGIADVVEKLIENPALAGCYNLSTGIGTSVAEFARTVAGVMKVDSGLLRFGELPMRPDDLPYVVGCPNKIMKAFGWKPDLTLEMGISKSVKELVLAVQ